MNPFAIPVMTFVAIVSLGGAVITVRSARRDKIRARLGRSDPSAKNTAAPANSSLFGALEKVGEVAGSQKVSPGLRAKLAQAGYHGRSAAGVYFGSKLALFVAGLAGASFVVLPMEDLAFHWKLMAVAWCGVVLFMIPNLIVEQQRRKRKQEIQNHLPNMLDLLEICVSAGMGLDLAWNSVAEEVRDVCSVLADEMALTDFEIHLNAPRALAMRHMAERSGADEISSLAAVLVQSDRFGTSIGDALRTFATSMREARSRRAEEHAEKMVVKLLFPMVLLIFPAIGVVICGPAALRWFEVMAGN